MSKHLQLSNWSSDGGVVHANETVGTGGHTFKSITQSACMGDSVPIPLNQINLTCSHTENITLSTTVDNESIDTTLTLCYLNQSYRFRVVLEGMLPWDAPNPFGCSYLYTHSGSDCNSTASVELKETSLLIDVEAPTCSGWTKYYLQYFLLPDDDNNEGFKSDQTSNLSYTFTNLQPDTRYQVFVNITNSCDEKSILVRETFTTPG